METGKRTIPEALLVEIIARLPLTSIARFKSVSKRWKSVIESDYFRRLFVSLHRQSSTSWSLMFRTEYGRQITQPIGFHGCKTWDLPKSLVSYIMPFQPYPNLPTSEYYYVASSNGLIWIDVFVSRLKDMAYSYKSFVGNPVLQEWVEVPPAPNPWVGDKITWYPNPFGAAGMVTRVENGVVSSFKMVMTVHMQLVEPTGGEIYEWNVCVYSSETGLWTFKKVFSSRPVNSGMLDSPVNLNGIMYLWDRHMFDDGPGVLVAHDFYGSEADDHCQVIPLPGAENEDVRRCLTTSGQDVIFIEVIYRELKVWRLTNQESERWLLIWDLILPSSVVSDVNCFPLAMNPFDTDIVYLWNRPKGCLVSGYLQTQEFIVHQESEDWSNSEGDCCRINTYDTEGYLEDRCDAVLMLSQFVLPPWMDSVPRPPN